MKKMWSGGVAVRRMGWTMALAAMGLSGQALHAQDRFEWSGDLSSSQSMEVSGIVGDVHAVLGSGSTAEVIATKHGDRDDFDEVQVRAVETRHGVEVCVIYGSWNFDREGCDDGWSNNDRHGDRDHHDNIDVSVEFEVRVPAGVNFHGMSVTGDVDVEGLRSDVHATSVSGDVRVSATGVVEASSVSGELDISMDSLDWDELEFSTVSGDITLRLPADLGAEIEFSSLSGDFRSDFDMRNEDRDKHRWVGLDVTGTIGDGRRTIELSTVSGDVEIRRN